jgi:hypothetical protein
MHALTYWIYVYAHWEWHIGNGTFENIENMCIPLELNDVDLLALLECYISGTESCVHAGWQVQGT